MGGEVVVLLRVNVEAVWMVCEVLTLPPALYNIVTTVKGNFNSNKLQFNNTLTTHTPGNNKKKVTINTVYTTIPSPCHTAMQYNTSQLRREDFRRNMIPHTSLKHFSNLCNNSQDGSKVHGHVCIIYLPSTLTFVRRN